jgi:hypothetical protein
MATSTGPEYTALISEVLDTIRDLQTMRSSRAPEDPLPFAEVALMAIVDDPTVMRALCPCLQNVSSDPQSIAIAITPVLASGIQSGYFDFPQNALIFASAAILIAETGVQRLCGSDSMAG